MLVNEPKDSIKRTMGKAGTRIFLITGLLRSGSTWLYNAVRQICLVECQSMYSTYSDTLTDDITTRLKDGDFVIVKSHRPSSDLLNFCLEQRGLVYLTIRDPRDCVASYMAQFTGDFGRACKKVARSCSAAVATCKASKPMIARYESGFTTNIETVKLLYTRAEIQPIDSNVTAVYNALRPEAVRSLVNEYFCTLPNTDWKDFQPETHWHPRHVGDGLVGKYKSQLSREQQRHVFSMTRRFFFRFYRRQYLEMTIGIAS
jgi:hypothetical protein